VIKSKAFAAALALFVCTSAGVPAYASPLAYITNSDDNTISVIDGVTRKTLATVRVGVSPGQMAVSRDRKAVYVASGMGSQLVPLLFRR